MKSLSNYIIEHTMFESIQYNFYELWLDGNIDFSQVKPKYILKENDIDYDEGEIEVMGKKYFVIDENNNFSDDPKAGDYVFDVGDDVALWRPDGKMGVCGGDAMGESVLIGTKENFETYVKECSRELENDYGYDIDELKEEIKNLK